MPNARQCLQLACEPSNVHDRTAVYNVAVKRPGLQANTVGHVLQDISRNVFYFLCNEGTTGHCLITGKPKKGKGLELPCFYTLMSINLSCA